MIFLFLISRGGSILCCLCIALLAFGLIILTTVEAQYLYYSEFKDDQPNCIVNEQVNFKLNCFNFAAWSQLVGLVNNTIESINTVSFLLIKPNQPLVLTGELNLWQVCSLIKPDNALACLGSLLVEIAGVKGIDIVSGWSTKNDKAQIEKNNTSNHVWIFSSALKFYMNGLALEQWQCTKEHVLKNLTQTTIFNYFGQIIFENSVVYDSENPVCPYFFINANITYFSINGLADSFLITNLFRFQKINSSVPINSSITHMTLSGYNYALDESLLHPLVFEFVQTVFLGGTINSISIAIESFKNLDKVQITANSLTNLFHKVGVDWMARLQISKNLLWITFAEYSFPEWLNPSGAYTYPNIDLCLFANLSLGDELKSGLVVVLDSNLTAFGCTDTVAWLTRNYNVFESSTQNRDFTQNSRQIYSMCWNGTYKPNMTAIETRINQCFSKQKGYYTVYMDYYEIEYLFQFANDLVASILIPFVCILGLLVNLRVIYTVHKNSKVDFKEAFYTFMSLNSLFNCFFSIIYALYPINYCQMNQTGFFCSSIYNTVTSQVIKIVSQAYFGEVFKMCSNILYIFISINRYMLVGKDHNSALEWLAGLNLKLVVFLTVVFSLLINIGHAFQYRIFYGWNVLATQYFHGSMVSTNYLYPSIVTNNSSFKIYSIVYFFINFAVFLAINTWIEFSLLRNLRKEIKEKRTKLEKEIQESESKNTSGSDVIKKVNRGKQKKIEQDSKKETRATVMVITNSGLNFVLRFPEIFVFVSSNSEFVTSIVDIFSGSLFSIITSTLVGISYLFYILTFTTNVVIYCVFNPNFKKHFIWWEYNVKQK
jgi:hypothetical protein